MGEVVELKVRISDTDALSELMSALGDWALRAVGRGDLTDYEQKLLDAALAFSEVHK